MIRARIGRVDLEALRVAVVPWLVSRCLVLAALAIAREIGSELGVEGNHQLQLGRGLIAWDASYYRDIAQGGYDAVFDARGLRFFPLLPMLTKALSTVLFVNTTAALLIISNLAALAFGVLLYRLVLHETSNADTARRAVWLGMLAPPAMVLVMGYAEGLMMALSVAVFLALRTRRWEVAAGLGVLAGLSRPTAALLMIPASIEALRAPFPLIGGARVTGGRAREWVRRAMPVVAPGFGVALFLLYAQLAFDDAFAPLRLQNSEDLRGGWHEPVSRLVQAAGDLIGGDQFGSGLHLIWILVGLGLVGVSIRKLPAAYSVYAAVSVCMAISANNLDSSERYILATIPVVIAAALAVRTEAIERFVLATSSSALVGYSVLGFLAITIP